MAFDFERYLQPYALDDTDFYNDQANQLTLSSDDEDVWTTRRKEVLLSKDNNKCFLFQSNNNNFDKLAKDDVFAWPNVPEHCHLGLEKIESRFRANQGLVRNSGGSEKIGLFKQTSLPASFSGRIGNKTKPETGRRRRNSVRFADEIGETLTTFLMIPSRFDDNDGDRDVTHITMRPLNHSVYPDQDNKATDNRTTGNKTTENSTKVDDKTATTTTTTTTTTITTTQDKEEATTLFQLCFDQPAANYEDFRRRLSNQFICLENVRIEVKSQTDGTSNGLVNHGTVLCTLKVRNINPMKRVFARCTDNNWRSYADITAVYVKDGTSTLNEYDTFTFALRNPFGYQAGTRVEDGTGTGAYSRKTASVEFALCYQVLGSEYWDNNEGENYRIVWL